MGFFMGALMVVICLYVFHEWVFEMLGEMQDNWRKFRNRQPS